ncbi:MAG: Ig-like domain-containing protein [Planctomycetota bacterium]|nr:Ig-like domain-containing protein [Planctomycetota bacterium]
MHRHSRKNRRKSRRHSTLRKNLRIEFLQRRELMAADVLVEFYSNVPGIDFSIDEQDYSTPAIVSLEEGTSHQLRIADEQTVGGQAYEFGGWSAADLADGEFTVPVGGASYNAEFEHNHDGHVHGHAEFDEKEAVFDLVRHEDATSIVVQDGAWSDPATWLDGEVPADGAKVLITEDRTVVYDVVSDVRIDTLRVDGTLRFATDVDTKLVVDTLVSTPGSVFQIGTTENSVEADVTARIVFAGQAPIDAADDPQQLGLGANLYGETIIHGAKKLHTLAIEGDAYAGDSELVLRAVPDGWRVGDQIVLGGTYYNENGSDDDNTRFHDEELTITEIDGNRVRFTNNDVTDGDNTRLRFDHTRREGFDEYDLKVFVANTTRNVSFESEQGEDTSIKQRGYVTVHHDGDAEVYNAGFYNLGRSDKRVLVDDAGTNRDGSAGNGTNIRGRHPLELRATDLSTLAWDNNPENARDTGHGPDDGHDHAHVHPSIDVPMSEVMGNAVVGSHSFGINQHGGAINADLNVVYDVVGAGMMAERGDELGEWCVNTVMKSRGSGKQTLDRQLRFDFGSEGSGYWLQGSSQVVQMANVAVSTNGSGLDLFGTAEKISRSRPVKWIGSASLPEDMRHIVTLPNGLIDIKDAPARGVMGFQAYNARRGIGTWMHQRNDDGQLGFTHSWSGAHSERTVISDFKLWNIFGSGIETVYSTQIDLVNGLIVGNPDSPIPFGQVPTCEVHGMGISSNSPAQNFLFKNLRIEGFEKCLKLPGEGLRGSGSIPFLGSRLENVHLANNKVNLFRQVFHHEHEKGFADNVQIVSSTFDVPTGNIAPTAEFEAESIGGAGVVQFDASDSFDIDPNLTLLTGNANAAYGWDFDADGQIDKFGRRVSHRFDSFGQHDVTLTVWDNQGETSILTKSIDAEPTAYPNLIVDSTFDQSESFHWYLVSTLAGEGWRGNDFGINDGAAVLTGGPWNAGVGQIIADYNLRQGQQTLSIDLASTEGDAAANQIHVRVFGVDGQFAVGGWRDTDRNVVQVGAIPMSETVLLDETVGGGGEDFDSTTFKWDVDFGEGYQFIMVAIGTTGASAANGDFIGIDNVYVGDSDRPLVQDDNATTLINSSVTIDVLANDVDLDSDALTIAGVSQAGHGTVAISDDGSLLTYTPEAGYFGADEFTYTVTDPDGNIATASVNVDVDVIDNDALIARFDFDEGRSRVVGDSSPYGVDQTTAFRRDPGWAEGVRGSAATFDGKDDYIQLRYLREQLDEYRNGRHDQVSVSLWFQASDITIGGEKDGGVRQVILNNGDYHSGMNVYLSQDRPGESRLYVGGWDRETGWAGTHLSTDQIKPGTWHHVTITLDGGSEMTTGAFRGYLDGVEFGRGDGTRLSGGLYSTSLGLDIGHTVFDDGRHPGKGARNKFAGKVDDLRIYHRTLSSEEAATLASVAVENNGLIGDQAMHHSEDSLQIALSAGRSYTVEMLGDQAWQLQQQFNFSGHKNYRFNNLGMQEKWLTAANGAFHKLMPNGELYRHGGKGDVLVAKLDASVYENPRLLTDARPTPVTATIEDGVLTIDPDSGYAGSFEVKVTSSDSSETTTEIFTVTVTNAGPNLSAIADQSVHATNSLTVALAATDADGDEVSFKVEIIEQLAAELRDEFNLQAPAWLQRRNFFEGQGVKWLSGNVVEGGDRGWFAIDQQGRVFSGWNRGEAYRTQIAQLSPEFYNDPLRLAQAEAPPVTVSIENGTLRLDPTTAHVGSYTVRVTATDGVTTSSQEFNVELTNSLAELSFGEQSMTSGGELTFDLPEFDADGDQLTFEVSVMENVAADLQAERQFRAPAWLAGRNFLHNLRSQNEKYFHGLNNGRVRWFIIKEDGSILLAGNRIEDSILIGKVDASYHADPTKLFTAQRVEVTARIENGALRIRAAAGYTGSFHVQVTISDGISRRCETVAVTVTEAPVNTATDDESRLQQTDSVFADWNVMSVCLSGR